MGTWPLPTAWGQECSLLTASLLGNTGILWIPGDQITFPCLGTRSLRTYLGTRAFLPARGHGHLLGDRVLLCFLGDMGIFWLLGDRVLFACSGTHFPLLEDRSPLYLGHLLPPWEQDHICLPGDKTPDYTPGTRSLLPAWGHGHLLAPWGQGPWPSPSSGTQLDGRPLRRAPHSSSGPPQVSWAGNNTEVAPRTAHLAWFNLITPNLRRHWHQD